MHFYRSSVAFLSASLVSQTERSANHFPLYLSQAFSPEDKPSWGDQRWFEWSFRLWYQLVSCECKDRWMWESLFCEWVGVGDGEVEPDELLDGDLPFVPDEHSGPDDDDKG